MNGFFQIGLAVVLGAVLLGGAFYYRNSTAGESVAVTSPQVATVLAPRVYQDVKDTDGDGLKDWEEELLGLDPNVPDTPEPTATIESAPKDGDGEDGAVEELSNTVTDRFARTFFEEYFTASLGDGELSEADMQAFLDTSVTSMTSGVRDDFYTRADIKTISATDIIALRDYGNALGSIVLAHPGGDENELIILKRALALDDAEELTALVPALAAYQDMVGEVLQLSAPTTLAKPHLDFLNSLVAIRNGIEAMYNTFNDPLPTLLRIKRYEDDVRGLSQAVDNLRISFEQAGVVYTQNEPGIFFFSLRP